MAAQGFEIETFRPHMMSDERMSDLIRMVGPSFIWYAPDSTVDDMQRLLRGNGESYVDVVFDGEDPCGFAAHYLRMIGGQAVNYRAGTSILPSARGNGVYKMLIERAFSQNDYEYLAARTQNPRVYETLRRFAGGGVIYPSPGQSPPEHVYEIASATSASGPVERDTLKVKNVFGHVRQDRSFMVARDPDVQAFFRETLGENDGYMVVVEL